jgi:hypothetical protein
MHVASFFLADSALLDCTNFEGLSEKSEKHQQKNFGIALAFVSIRQWVYTFGEPPDSLLVMHFGIF